MKLSKGVLLIVVITLSNQAMALNPNEFEISNTSHLLDLCNVSTEDALYNEAMGFSFGNIDVALDYHEALTAGVKHDSIICPSSNVTREAVVIVVREWARNNPQHLRESKNNTSTGPSAYLNKTKREPCNSPVALNATKWRKCK